jgi:hypothetical protein
MHPKDCVCIMCAGYNPLNTAPGQELKDSGERRGFSTGAVRDAANGKARWDLMPMFAMARLAQHFRKGAEKYEARNWEKGMPLSVFFTSAMNHMGKYLAGFTDEPHLDAALWNIACMVEGEERIKRGLWPAEFDDMPKTFAGKEPW